MLTDKLLYQPDSKILIMTICSLHKKLGGKSEYDERASIGFKIEPKTKDFLLKSRQEALNLLISGKIKWQRVSLQSLEYNKDLKYGKDFGGTDPYALYLPAIDRYNGRFFVALGEDGKYKLLCSKHHILFLSGLYGLITPTEPIQLYSCPIEEGSETQKIWKKDDILTKILIEYVKNKGIKRIFDLTSSKVYRELINWNYLMWSTGADVLYCFFIQGGGYDALIPFGKLLKNFMLEASEKELMNIQPETIMDEILFRDVPYTLEELPKEELKRFRQEESKIRIQTIERDDWDPQFKSEFIKDFSQIKDKKIKRRVLEVITEILKNPCEPRGNTQIPISEGMWRYRIGKYRLVYFPYIEKNTIYYLLLKLRKKINYDELKYMVRGLVCKDV